MSRLEAERPHPSLAQAPALPQPATRNPRPALPIFVLSAVVLACGNHSPSPVEATGTLEVVETDVSPMLPARVTRLWVDEGARVHPGDTLVALTTSTIRADIEARRARVAAAEAQLRELEHGARPAEIARAEADLRSAEAEAQRTASDLRRMEPLAARGDISAQQLDAVRGTASVAAGRRDAAREALRLLQAGTRPERIRAARAELANARAALAAAEGTASDLVLVAPVGGVVLSRHVEPGEMLAAGEAALTVGDVARPWVRVYVDERALPRIRVGEHASATLDAFPTRAFDGRVVAVSDKAEFTPRVALTERERADLLFGVKVEFADSTGMLKPGLPITVRFDTSRTGADSADRPPRIPLTSR